MYVHKLTFAAALDQPRFSQNTQVVGDGRWSQAVLLDDLSTVHVGLRCDGLVDLQAAGIRQCLGNFSDFDRVHVQSDSSGSVTYTVARPGQMNFPRFCNFTFRYSPKYRTAGRGGGRWEDDMPRLTGKVAVVTGGNSGIGLATAKRFHAEGAQVVISGRDQKTLDEAVKSIGDGVVAVQADVSKLNDLDKLYKTVSQKFGKIDVLFANAGIAGFAPVADSGEALFDEQFDVNVKGVYFTIQKALPLLTDGASVIINSSVVNETESANMKIGRAHV